MRVWGLGALALAMAVGGCATGRINSGYPWPVEPASAAMAGKRLNGDDPLRQMQVDVSVVLAAALRRDGLEVLEGNAPTGASPTDAQKTVDVRGLGDRAKLDKLVGAVGAAPSSKQIRNDVATQVLAASNHNCNVYLQALRGGQVSGRLLSDLLASSFGAAGSLAKSTRTATRLSAMAGLSVATGASVDRNIFAQQGAELVADSIVQLRAEDRAKIETKLRSPYADWPIGLALADLADYHGSCSMLRGFSRMRETITTRESTVAALRDAAAVVAERGGSGEMVAAIITSSERPKPPSPVDATLGRADIDANLRAGIVCLQAAEKMMIENPAIINFTDQNGSPSRPGECISSKPWPDSYLAQAREALKIGDATLLSAIQAKQGQRAVNAAAKDDPTLHNELLALLGKVGADYDNRVRRTAEAQYGARVLADQSLDKVGVSQTPQFVIDLLTALGGSSASVDPVFIQGLEIAKASAAAAPPLTFNGEDTARAADAAMHHAYADLNK